MVSLWVDCEQSLFGQSRLSSAGLERANSRERGKRECEASESRGEAREKAGKEENTRSIYLIKRGNLARDKLRRSLLLIK